MLRLAGHDFVDFRVNDNGSTQGGSDGCINFGDPDHRGTMLCMQEFELNEAYQPFCTTVSRADWFVIAGEAIMGRTASDYNPDDQFSYFTTLGQFRSKFKYGRTTRDFCSTSGNKMPYPPNGCEGL